VAVYFNDLDHAVFFTLVYSDYFNYPLKKTESYQHLPKVWDWDFLTGVKLKSDRFKIDKNSENFTKSLEKLEKAKKIAKLKVADDDYYFLTNRQQLVKLRLNKEKIAYNRRAVILQASQYLLRFPSIQALGLTGASAMNNASLADDLDFCIIVKKNTLWLTRLVVIVVAKILGKRPQIDAHAKNENKQAWCFNLWLDESSLNIAQRGFSIYQAYELRQMDFLFDKASIQKKLWLQNWQFAELLDLNLPNNDLSSDKDNLIDYFLWPINGFLYLIQKIYRRLAFGKEDFSLNLHQAHFNHIGRQDKIFKSIKKKLQSNAFTDL